ncbi:MAG: nitrilase family protein [Flavobacteriales bacterium]|nr:nitrilase family protein [Flavobacteriales bacterium]
MSSKLDVCLVESAIIGSDINQNLENIYNKVQNLTNIDLIVLPETFDTGFNIPPRNVFDFDNNPSILWMKTLAVEKQCAICGSLMVKEKDSIFNRFVFYDNVKDIIHTYDKLHLFSVADEDKHITSGTEIKSFMYKDWKICPQICYDLRFPVLTKEDVFDIIVYVANWPLQRINAWDLLLPARAIENQSFVIGVNRNGHDDENDINYPGHSRLISFKGDDLNKQNNETDNLVYQIDLNNLKKYRLKYPFLQDRR